MTKTNEKCRKGTDTGLKEGGGIEMSTTVLPLRDARSLRFEKLYLDQIRSLDLYVLEIDACTQQHRVVVHLFRCRCR